MKKFIILIFIFILLFFLYLFFYTFPKEKNFTFNLINSADTNSLFNNKLAPGSFGEFSINLDSRKNIKYSIYLNDFYLPSNFYIYINGKFVDNLENSFLLYTDYTNNVTNLNIKWYWSYYSKNIFSSSKLFINLKIIFERNF